jgi:hypothetical protein
MDAEEDSKAHFNLDDLLIDGKNNKKKAKKFNKNDIDSSTNKKADNFEVDLKDPRFNAIFTDHKFNIDPSDQSFKKTKAMETILNEKIKRIQNNEFNQDSVSNVQSQEEKASREDASLSLMVKSIKSKTEILKRKKDEINNIKKKIRLNRF